MKEFHPSRKLLLATGIVLSLAATGCVRKEQDPLKKADLKLNQIGSSERYSFTTHLLTPANYADDLAFLNQYYADRMGAVCTDFGENTIRDHLIPGSTTQVLDGIDGSATCRFDESYTGPQPSIGNAGTLDRPGRMPAEWQPPMKIR